MGGRTFPFNLCIWRSPIFFSWLSPRAPTSSLARKEDPFFTGHRDALFFTSTHLPTALGSFLTAILIAWGLRQGRAVDGLPFPLFPPSSAAFRYITGEPPLNFSFKAASQCFFKYFAPPRSPRLNSLEDSSSFFDNQALKSLESEPTHFSFLLPVCCDLAALFFFFPPPFFGPADAMRFPSPRGS